MDFNLFNSPYHLFSCVLNLLVVEKATEVSTCLGKNFHLHNKKLSQKKLTMQTESLHKRVSVHKNTQIENL